ncbi:YncE family protein [Bacillus inaquosorum]|uniref:YncE family protein n=1 Tax=Bacillus inaquosorum TaxID=483913 RepID=UPI00227F21C5|nr:YncE family protein [Bacillus inaquosorum]MCY8797528.1 YncE family protein [Bacillus inaquosorum]MCY9010541.1 YncE family protein [Bacillus inaquosorum]MCY9036694.1 YncE family protein [Bacillus inaquosorum]MCY9045024.1 YncE family protein [Bacillus inaquosorum]MCY9177739.1 YncE family protein [Bacillus inaquosorum]
MKKNDLSDLQENCFCFCDEEISREAPFQVPIDIPEGFTIDSAEAAAAVTWSTDNLSCISEPCLIQTGPEREDIGVQYAVRLQGTVTLLVSVSPVRNQYGQGDGAVSVIHNAEIDQVVYYSDNPDDCPDFSGITIENLVVVPPFYGSPLSVTGTIVLVPEPDQRSYVFTANTGDSTVSVIDTDVNTLVSTISLSAIPTDLGVTLDKAYTYVLHRNANLVSIINNETLTVTQTIPLAGAPRKIQFETGGEFAYILAGGSSIYEINISSQTITNTFTVSPAADDFALDPNGQFFYTTNSGFWVVNKYDINTGQLIDSLSNFETPNLIETPLIGDFAYLENGELRPNVVSVIDLTTFSESSQINRLFDGLITIVFSADGTRAFFLEPYFEAFPENLTVVDTAQHTFITTASLPGASDLAVTPDNQYIYAAQPNDNTVTVYRTSDYTAVTVIPVGTGPSAIAI